MREVLGYDTGASPEVDRKGRWIVPRTTRRILASHPAPADCSHLVELAGRMSVPTDFAIHQYIDLANRHDVTANTASTATRCDVAAARPGWGAAERWAK